MAIDLRSTRWMQQLWAVSGESSASLAASSLGAVEATAPRDRQTRAPFTHLRMGLQARALGSLWVTVRGHSPAVPRGPGGLEAALELHGNVHVPSHRRAQ